MNGFTIYREYFDLITLLPKKDQSELLLAICNYMFFDEEPNLNESQMKIFRNLKRPLDKSKKRSLSGSTTNSNNNREENKNKSKQNQNQNKNKSNKNQNEIEKETHQDVNVNVNDIVNVNNLEKIECEKEKPFREIIDYLNLKINSHYKHSTDKTKSLIKARINDGFTLEDFKTVIDKKYDEWVGTDMEKYLRPETLFGNKFESYLNQKTINKPKTKNDEQWEILKGVYDGTFKID